MGLIVWGCEYAAQLPAWAAGCLIWAVWVCATCVRDAAGRSDRGRAGGAGRSVAGAAVGCGAADPVHDPPAGCVGCVHQSGAAMWVWDSSQQVLATQGAVYVQGHCLQEQRLYKRLPCLQVLGPLQEHTTFRESLVCYTSPPGGVYVLGVLPGVFIIQSAGCRGRYGFALPGPGRPAQSTGLGCPDSQATYARRLHIGFCLSYRAAGYRMVTVHRFQRLS